MKCLPAIAITVLSLSFAASAHAGTYEVKACYGELGNGSWSAEVTSGYATAYTACPGAGEGIVTRLSGAADGSRAPFGAGARHSFTPPPGTRVVRFRANVHQNSARGWYAGLVDSTPRWVWCGNACTTWGRYQWTDVGLNTSQLFAQVTCGDFNGCPRWNMDALMAMRDVVVTVEDPWAPYVTITGGSVTAGGWRSGDQDVAYFASDPSGIRMVEVIVDGRVRSTFVGSCSEVMARPCQDHARSSLIEADSLPDGRRTVVIRAHDGAWNRSDVRRDVFIDHTPPDPPLDAQLETATAWRQQNAFVLRWQNPPQAAAPITAARYAICPSTNQPGNLRGCALGLRAARGISAIPDVHVPRSGDWRIALWLEDEAGNSDINRSVTVPGLRLDDGPPDLAFDELEQADPTRVHVTATDAVSGIALGQIEARRRGENAWRSLRTTLDKSGFSATLDDETLPKGKYELRARAVDHAGNERSTHSLKDGQPAKRSLPLRIRTRLAVGKPKRVRASGSRGRRHRTIFIVRPRARYGRTIPLRGRLTTPGANPLPGADLEVWERVNLPAAEWRRISVVRTSRTGRFRFKALRGPSRLLRFRYPGTPTIRARSTQVELRVRAVTSLRVSNDRAVNGEEIVFRGRLKGRQPGETGKLIHLQVYTRGRWSTFATPRANRVSGTWRLAYRFTATRGRVDYRFRALVPREASYPYDTGVSHSVRVTVQGL